MRFFSNIGGCFTRGSSASPSCDVVGLGQRHSFLPCLRVSRALAAGVPVVVSHPQNMLPLDSGGGGNFGGAEWPGVNLRFRSQNRSRL